MAELFDAAGRLGITHAHLCNLEGGHVWPGVPLLVRLADLYGVSTDRLLGREG